MISLLDPNNKLSEHKNSLNITYPRSVNIIFGNYPYPDAIHNFMIDIKCNLDPAMENYSNVKGGMTDWNYFVGKPEFNKFMTFLINKHQTTHPDIFAYFLERSRVIDAWGNEVKKNDSIYSGAYHETTSFSCSRHNSAILQQFRTTLCNFRQQTITGISIRRFLSGRV